MKNDLLGLALFIHVVQDQADRTKDYNTKVVLENNIENLINIGLRFAENMEEELISSKDNTTNDIVGHYFKNR